MTQPQPRLGELLVDSGAVTSVQLETAVRRQRSRGGRIGTNLVELGFIDERTLAKVLSGQLKIPAATAAQLESIDAKVVALIPSRLAELHRVVPVREDGDRLWLVMADPTDASARAELERVCQRTVRPMVAPDLLIQFALEAYYGVKRRTISSVSIPAVESENLLIENVSIRRVPDSQPLVVRTGMAAPRKTPKRDERPHRSIAQLAAELAQAATEADVLGVAMRALREDAPKIAVLVSKQGGYVGWHGEGVDLDELTALRAEVEEVPVMAQPLHTGQAWAGTLTAALLGSLGRALAVAQPTNGLVLPVLRAGHPVGCMFALDVEPDPRARLADLDQLALKLDHALCILYHRRQLLG